MSYPQADSFPWRSDERVRNTRIIAAIALIAAGWAVGFLSGRMSAWVFPVTNPDLAALKASMQQTLPQSAIDAKVSADEPARPTEETDRPTLALSPPVSEADAQQSVTAKNELFRPLTSKTEEPEAKTQPSPHEAVLVNPQWTARLTAEPAPRAERDRTSDAGITECERRYSSFRASDGTYQPYGRSSRVVCPHLRRASEESPSR